MIWTWYLAVGTGVSPQVTAPSAAALGQLLRGVCGGGLEEEGRDWSRGQWDYKMEKKNRQNALSSCSLHSSDGRRTRSKHGSELYSMLDGECHQYVTSSYNKNTYSSSKRR